MRFLITLLIMSSTITYSQHIYGQFMNTDVFRSKIYLYDMFQNEGKPIDETIIDSYLIFSFNKTDYNFLFFFIQL
jgi:hypothetical protein